MTWKDTPPPGCAPLMDFRAECNVSTPQVQVPAAIPSAVPQAPAAPVAAVPDPVPTQVPAQHAPVDHIMPPHDWQPPSWHFDMPSVGDVMHLGLAASGGAALAGAAAFGLIRTARAQGLEPRELAKYAGASLVLPAGSMVVDGSWSAPAHLLVEAATAAQMGGGYLVGAVAAASITAIPAGWTAAAVWWSRRRQQERDGLAGSSPKRSLRFQRRHEAAKARAGRKAAKSASVPFVAGWPLPTRVVLGVCSKRTCATPDTMWSSLFSRHDDLLGIPMSALDEHLFALGGTGSGKTTMLLRLSVGMFHADWQRHLAGGPRPLLVFLDCGGDKNTAKRFVEVAARIGIQPDRIGLWPDNTALDLWSAPAEEITETLQKMVCPTAPADSAQEYFFKSRRRIVRLAIGTADHVGPAVAAPRSRKELFARLSSTDALKRLYPKDKAIQEEIDGFSKTKPPMVSSVLGILRDIWDTLGAALDTGKPLDAYDALFLRVQGTTMKDSARAQAAALLEMVLKYAARGDTGRRIRMILDETSAVNDAGADIGVVEVLERARKYGMSIVLSAQNVEGLAPDTEGAKRIMKAASGGAIFMRGRGTGEACELFGTAPKSEATRHTLGGRHGDEGSTGVSDTFLVSPEAVDEMEKGDMVYVNQRVAVWGHVTETDLADLPRIEQTDESVLPQVEPRARLVPVPDQQIVDLDAEDDTDTPDFGEAAS